MGFFLLKQFSKEFTYETNNPVGLIPSRRQVEWDGGYVNNWTTEIFSKYFFSQHGIKKFVKSNVELVDVLWILGGRRG